MSTSKSKLVESFLAKPVIHQRWENDYLTAENEEFYERAFNDIAHALSAPENATVLDAGCGTCAHSIRLAKRGFLVRAVDFSESVLTIAKEKVKTEELGARIYIQHESLLELSFEKESFDYILCWGVLMHIPEVEKALSELARVLKPGGILVISETNMYSLQALALRSLKQSFGREKAEVRRTKAGLEYWTISSSDALVTREANIEWLIERLKSNRLIVKQRIAGQFTEAYTRVSSAFIKKLIHSFNNFWFRSIKIPHFAYGNIVILQKQQ